MNEEIETGLSHLFFIVSTLLLFYSFNLLYIVCFYLIKYHCALCTTVGHAHAHCTAAYRLAIYACHVCCHYGMGCNQLCYACTSHDF